ncbi:hypothetical protein E4S40_15430 [Algoriphagus kandeliae]|uniref:Uncharacterized protein n=1 Tax=Algoriphagus kandeliae TaxID=2562278 RepID=A0A4Y9QRI6_9BACT|nr:DUF6090 family protein [Algoriphagus kandeliae]TFV93633.1 hypothetical protein E4S40_15430 [Algoriphagus kandeliae]
MISFFRKIRQKLLSQKRITRYLIYALGEILLVVIGILIALSINNWNEDRKNKIKERELLNELTKDLREDLVMLEFQLSQSDSILKYLNVLKNPPPPGKAFDDALASADKGTLANYRYSAMRSIESIGIDIIQSKDLLESINNYYRWWDFGNEIYRIDFDEFWKSEWLPFFRKYTDRGVSGGNFSRTFSPKDYEGMINDPDYQNILMGKIYIFQDFKLRFESTRMRGENLIEEINEYLSTEMH